MEEKYTIQEKYVTGEFPVQRPMMRTFDVSFDLRLKKSWVNDREAGDFIRDRAHYDAIVMNDVGASDIIGWLVSNTWNIYQINSDYAFFKIKIKAARYCNIINVRYLASKPTALFIFVDKIYDRIQTWVVWDRKYIHLTQWGRDKMATVSQTTLSNAFSLIKLLEFRLRFHWSFFLRVQLTIIQHWFR